MSIYPNGRPDLRYTWQVAALNLPIPENLLDERDQRNWNSYAKALPPGRLLETLGQALDEFHTALQDADLKVVPMAEKIRIYAKWQAADILGCRTQERLEFSEENIRQRFRSDLSLAIYSVMDLLRATASPQLPVWEKRAQTHLAVDHMKPFDDFLNEMAAEGYKSGSAQSQVPKPSL